MHKSATKCNETVGKWCKNKHGASKIIDTLETYQKPLGRINDVLIMVNNNLVPIDFLVLDIEYNASCPIILGRSFLRTVGAIIDMKEGTIKYQFPLKKGMEHFLRKRKKLLFDSILRANYELDASSLENT
jgi:hypothetical protein